MSTENRVESSLSAVVARRSSRSSLDTAGMGFQEELLSLTFESQTDFASTPANPQNTSSSVEQDENDEDNKNFGKEEENGIRDKEQQDFAFPFPLPQRPIADSPTPIRDSEIIVESPLGPEPAKGSLSVDNVKGEPKRSLSEYPAQRNDLDQETASNKLDLPQQSTPSLGDRKTSAAVEKQAEFPAEKPVELPAELPEHTTVDHQMDLNQNLKPEVDAGPLIDSQSSLVKQEPKKPIRNLSSDADRGAITQDVELKDNSTSAVDRIAPIDEAATNQDSLPFEQDAAPTRTRRVSRQDRIRDDKEGETNQTSLESKQSKVEDVSVTKTLDAVGQNVDSPFAPNQLNGLVSQPLPPSSLETNFSVAGQPSAAQSETLVVNGASNNGAAGSTVTAAIAGTADKTGTTESGSVQPTAAGSGRGESLGSASRGTVRSEGSTGTSTLSRFQQTKLVQRVLKGLEQLSNGGGQVKLRLHPPELGTLQMTLKIEANVMSAHLEVENSLAKEALLNNLQSLRDRLSDQGMSIDRFEVEVRTDSQSGANSSSGESASNRQSRRDQPESRYAIYNENRLPSEATSEPTSEGKPSVPWFRTTGKLDLSV
jgi:flagellar hook-length control protein FliK